MLHLSRVAMTSLVLGHKGRLHVVSTHHKKAALVTWLMKSACTPSAIFETHFRMQLDGKGRFDGFLFAKPVPLLTRGCTHGVSGSQCVWRVIVDDEAACSLSPTVFLEIKTEGSRLCSLFIVGSPTTQKTRHARCMAQSEDFHVICEVGRWPDTAAGSGEPHRRILCPTESADMTQF